MKKQFLIKIFCSLLFLLIDHNVINAMNSNKMVSSHSNQPKSHGLVCIKEESYLCSTCNNRFTQRGDLNRHMRIHTKEKLYTAINPTNRYNMMYIQKNDYSCNTCDERFTHKGNMIIHMRSHIKIKPYSCDICKKEFRHYGNLTNHKRTHIMAMHNSFSETDSETEEE
jgi:uncharacterized Zn-finger protein